MRVSTPGCKASRVLRGVNTWRLAWAVFVSALRPAAAALMPVLAGLAIAAVISVPSVAVVRELAALVTGTPLSRATVVAISAALVAPALSRSLHAQGFAYLRSLRRSTGLFLVPLSAISILGVLPLGLLWAMAGHIADTIATVAFSAGAAWSLALWPRTRLRWLVASTCAGASVAGAALMSPGPLATLAATLTFIVAISLAYRHSQVPRPARRVSRIFGGPMTALAVSYCVCLWRSARHVLLLSAALCVAAAFGAGQLLVIAGFEPSDASDAFALVFVTAPMVVAIGVLVRAVLRVSEQLAPIVAWVGARPGASRVASVSVIVLFGCLLGFVVAGLLAGSNRVPVRALLTYPLWGIGLGLFLFALWQRFQHRRHILNTATIVIALSILLVGWQAEHAPVVLFPLSVLSVLISSRRQPRRVFT